MRRLGLGIVVVLALSGAAALDRLSPASPPLPSVDRTVAPGGVWACPVVKAPGTRGWLHVVNAGDGAAQIRVTYVPDAAKPVEQALALPAGRATTVGTPAAIAKFGAGALVEYAGGDVTVSRSVMLADQGASGVAAASCARPGASSLVVPQGLTLNGETQIAMLNPGTADALVDIALLFRGERLEPQSLSRRIVPAGGRLVIREGDFAFDEADVAALIVARSGRVVADGVMFAARSRLFEIVPAQAAATELVTVASTALGAARFSAITAADEDAVTNGLFISRAGQTTYEPLTTGLQPDTPKAGGPPSQDVPPGPVALAVSSGTGPLAIGARWLVTVPSVGVESAASSGVQPSRRAVAVLGSPGTASAMGLLIVNPDPREAIVSVTLVTRSGATRPPPLQGLRVGAGRTTAIALPAQPANATLGVVLTSTHARIAAVLDGRAAIPNAFSVFAVTAVPAARVPAVAVQPDPRQGVPAQ